jgi:transcriptional regulator with XRE-family HTH domain
LPNYFDNHVKIHPCISYWRKSRLPATVTEAYPWDRALTRLLVEKGWKSTVLAEKAGVPQSRISELRKTDRPYMPLVQTLAAALQVPLWEFFVTDEQSRVLRQIDHAQKTAVNEDALIERAMQKMRTVHASPLQVAAGSMTTLSASVSNLRAGESVTAYQWDWEGAGKGTTFDETSIANSRSHVYPTDGIRNPIVQILTSAGRSATGSGRVIVFKPLR